ncbi:unnamed protein product [Diplocarpon coronariae]
MHRLGLFPSSDFLEVQLPNIRPARDHWPDFARERYLTPTSSQLAAQRLSDPAQYAASSELKPQILISAPRPSPRTQGPKLPILRL